MRNLLSVEQVSSILQVSKDTLRGWDNSGQLPSIRTPGGHRRWRQSDIVLPG